MGIESTIASALAPVRWVYIYFVKKNDVHHIIDLEMFSESHKS